MCCIVELLNVQSVTLELDDSSFVVVHITVVRSREYSNYNREFRRTVPLVHLVAIKLSLMSSQD